MAAGEPSCSTSLCAPRTPKPSTRVSASQYCVFSSTTAVGILWCLQIQPSPKHQLPGCSRTAGTREHPTTDCAALPECFGLMTFGLSLELRTPAQAEPASGRRPDLEIGLLQPGRGRQGAW